MHFSAPNNALKAGWTTGKDQSLSGLVALGGAAVPEDVKEDLTKHIERISEKWKAGKLGGRGVKAEPVDQALSKHRKACLRVR